MNIEPPERLPTWGLVIMLLASALGVYLLGWELYRRI